MSWTSAKGFNTPKGVYVPKTDDLKAELIAAAKFAGLEAFNVKLDGLYIDDPSKLPTNSIAALIVDVTLETIEVEPFDTAGI